MKRKKTIIPFGLHLMIDAYECSHDLLDNMEVSYKF